jgi:hypothetical protein
MVSFFFKAKSGRYEEEIMGVLPGHQTSNLRTCRGLCLLNVTELKCSALKKTKLVSVPAVDCGAVNVQPGAVRP